MKSHFSLTRGVATACAVTGATAMITSPGPAQAFTAADYATNSPYSDGWQEGDNGGFGFGPWSMFGTYNSLIQNDMDSTSPYNNLGLSWTLYLPAGVEPNGGTPNPPAGSDISRAGRSFAPLQVGQTLTTLIDNPTERRFYNGYTIRLVSGTNNVTYGGTSITRLAVGTFEYFTYGRWYGPAGNTSLYDTDTAAAGMRMEVTMTGPNNYRLILTPLANPANAYTNFGTFEGSGPINWMNFELYNTDSDFFPTPVGANPQSTDFYIRSMTISDVQPIPPEIVVQPSSRVLYPGRTARFSASAIGTTLSYQWRKNGTNITNGGNISGALNDTLVINSVGPADVAAYTLVVSNSLGVVTSAPPAQLTLALPSGTPYENAVLAANPLAHWRLNENSNPTTNPPAYDFAGGLAGYYGGASSNGFNGIVGPRPGDTFYGFETGNQAMKSTGNSADSWVTIPPLSLNTDTVTLTAWIYPNGAQADYTGLVFTRKDGLAEGMHYGGAFTGTAGQLAYTWNNNNQNTWGFFSDLTIPANQWSLIAVAIAPTEAILYVYNASSQSAATNTIPHTVEPWNGVGTIGGDPGNSVGRTFDGSIDEVAIFNRTLSPAEIRNLYNAASSVTLTLQRSSSDLTLNWPTGTLLEANSITGPWTTNAHTSPYTFAPAEAKKFFRVKVQ